MLGHFMLVQHCQELVVEVLPGLGSRFSDGSQLAAMASRVRGMVLTGCDPDQCSLHVMQLIHRLQKHCASVGS